MTDVLLQNLILALVALGLVAYVISLPLRLICDQDAPSTEQAPTFRDDASPWESAA